MGHHHHIHNASDGVSQQPEILRCNDAPSSLVQAQPQRQRRRRQHRQLTQQQRKWQRHQRRQWRVRRRRRVRD
ncbi:hypothetical protein ACFX2C_018064 [Malus domestica]